MSSNKALIISVIFIWTIIGGYYLLTPSKKIPGIKRITAKLSAGLNVDFKMITTNPEINKKIELIANISPQSDSLNYDYQLFMPSNSDLISPHPTGTITLVTGESLDLPISFTQSVSYDMKIHLEIRQSGTANASMFTFSTLDFHKNQEEVDALQNRQSDYKK